MSANCSASVEPAERGDRELERLAGGHRRLADLAGGDLDVLLLDRAGPRRWPSGCGTASFCGSSQTRML